jgi:hypothetical protein
LAAQEPEQAQQSEGSPTPTTGNTKRGSKEFHGTAVSYRRSLAATLGDNADNACEPSHNQSPPYELGRSLESFPCGPKSLTSYWIARIARDPVVTGNHDPRSAGQCTSPYCDVIRVVLLAAEGLSNDVIATRLDTSRQIVSQWRKRFALAQLPAWRRRPTRPLFPPASSSKLKLSPVNSHIACSCPCRDFLFPRFGAK